MVENSELSVIDVLKPEDQLALAFRLYLRLNRLEDESGLGCKWYLIATGQEYVAGEGLVAKDFKYGSGGGRPLIDLLYNAKSLKGLTRTSPNRFQEEGGSPETYIPIPSREYLALIQSL